MSHPNRHPLWPLLAPESVAIVGASRHPGKVGHIIVRNLLASGYHGRIYPVNPFADEILGLKCYHRLKDVPKPVDMVVVAVPAKLVPSVAREACEVEAKVLVVISAGFSEVGNKELEERLVEEARSCGARVLGPNIFGVIYTPVGLNAAFGPEKVPRGNISVASQSGALGLALLYHFVREEVGVAAFISMGNMADIDFADVIDLLAEDPETKVIALYIEGLKPAKGRRFVEAARKAVAAGKPVFALKAGRSSRGAKAVASHTGSLAGSIEAYKAALRRAGVVMITSLPELLGALSLASKQPIPEKLTRIGIVTNGGGLGVMMTDALQEAGLQVPELSDETKVKLRSVLPWFASLHNPVDTTATAKPEAYAEAVKLVALDPNVDAVVMIYAELPNMNPDALANAVKSVLGEVRSTGKPLLAVLVGGDATAKLSSLLEEANVPVYSSPSEAAAALRAVSEYTKLREKIVGGGAKATPHG